MSPVTTLLSYAQDQADKTRILGALNIEESDLKRNFYNTFIYNLHNDNYHIFCQGKKNTHIQAYLEELGQL